MGYGDPQADSANALLVLLAKLKVHTNWENAGSYTWRVNEQKRKEKEKQIPSHSHTDNLRGL
jgi:hypothetical protein